MCVCVYIYMTCNIYKDTSSYIYIYIYIYTKPVLISYMSSRKTRHQRLNSYLVMNSLEDRPVHAATPSNPVIKIEYMYEFHNVNFSHHKKHIDLVVIFFLFIQNLISIHKCV